MPGKGKNAANVQRILDDPGDRQTLVVLFIPSHDSDEKELPHQDVWADSALDLFADLFNGATAFSTYAGIYRDKKRGKNLRDKPILVESYTDVENIKDAGKLTALVEFMKRMGRECKQVAVGVVISNSFHEIADF
jgi:hypothetical protein